MDFNLNFKLYIFCNDFHEKKNHKVNFSFSFTCRNIDFVIVFLKFKMYPRVYKLVIKQKGNYNQAAHPGATLLYPFAFVFVCETLKMVPMFPGKNELK